MENIPDRIYFKDRHSRFIYGSKSFAKWFQRDISAILGKTDFDFFSEVHARAAFDDEQEIIRSGEGKLNLEEMETWPDGRITWCSTSKVPLRDAAGAIIGILGISKDITARKRVTEELVESNRQLQAATAQAEAATRAKSEFLSNMSHEIRTPLNGVLGMAELLLGSEMPFEQMDYVVAINRSGQRLMALLNDILDFSKIEAGQLSLESVPFDLGHLIFDVAELFQAQLVGRPVELLADVDLASPPHVIGDPGRIRQILNNLVSNAIKFTETGYILIEVRSHQREDGCRFYQIAVKDTGIGISAEKQVKLFQPFIQADSSTARRYGGTGLGLAIGRRIAEAMGGYILLESQAGVGSSLFVNIPLKLDTGYAGVPPDLGELTGKRVLVIDNLAINRQLQCRNIENHGGASVSAASGAEALQQVNEALDRGEPFDAVVADIHMTQGMDGETFGINVRMDPRCERLALVAVTVTGVRGDATRLAKLGFDGYLTKPVNGNILARVIVSAIRQRLNPTAEAIVTRHSVMEANVRQPPPSQIPITARILVVEDQEINQVIARKFLEMSGAAVEVAGNGRIAMERLAVQNFDLILMDCQMPEMDGFEATRLIRAQEALTGRHLPIIAMTASAMGGDRDQCLAAGMDAHLPKPISREALIRMVSHTLAQLVDPESGSAPREPAILPAAPVTVLDLDMLQFKRLWEVYGSNSQEMWNAVIEPIIRSTKELLLSRDPQPQEAKQPEPPPGEAHAGIDEARFQEMQQLFAENFHDQVLGPALTILEAQLLELETAVQERTIRAVQQLAHKVKGAARNLGFTGLGTLAEDMEMEAKRGKLATLNQVGAFKSEVRAIQEYIRVIKTA